MVVDPSFWKSKKVFLTGHTGFKGSWLSLWLNSMGAKVAGYALEPPTNPSLFHEAKVDQLLEFSQIADIRDLATVVQSVKDFDPDILIHMAAQPLVLDSYDDPVYTYQVNVMGVVHVLEAARATQNLKVIINVTTDKCYENREWVWGYRENEAMGGFDPYSSSKGCSELVTAAYRRSFFDTSKSAFPCLASVRAGNVIGGGDWAKNRLIPDAIRAFSKSKKLEIRRPQSIRPWQHVLEPLKGYLMLAQRMYHEPKDFDSAWNFGPHVEDAQPVRWVIEKLASFWGDSAQWFITEETQSLHEAHFLKLDCSKAHQNLHWQPLWLLEKSLQKIATWYKEWLAGKNARTLCLEEIKQFMLDTNQS